MAHYILRQPNGLLAIFSSVVDDFTVTDMTEEEAVRECQSYGMSEEESRAKVKRGQDDVDLEDDLQSSDSPHDDKLGRWHEALSTILVLHGWERCYKWMKELGGIQEV